MSENITKHNKQEYSRAIEAAKLLRIHRCTVWRLIASNRLPATKVARSWRIRREDVERLLP